METISIQRPRKKRGGGLRWLVLIFGLAGMAVGAYWGWERFVPNNERVVPDYAFEHPIMHLGQPMEYGGAVEGEAVKLPVAAVQALLGSEAPVRYETESKAVILTTTDKVLHFKTEALTATMNQEPFELSIAAEEQDGTVYIPMPPLTELFGLQAELHTDTGMITVSMPGDAVQRAAVTEEAAQLRSGPSIKSPIYETIASGGTVRLWDEQDGWYYAQSASGRTGYMRVDDVGFADIETTAQAIAEEPFIPWKVYGQRINMTWEGVYSRNPDPQQIGELPGVNVVSPTWFELTDAAGTIQSKADERYVAWAHGQDMQVWALFSNGFEPDRTTAALASYETRLTMIKQLLAFAEVYRLQGINIDFENVYTADKANLIQFVREMTPLLHEQGLVVSIDVTPKSNSEMWSAFIDRRELGQVVDYMMVMTYDEHWAASPVAGSVASLPWVEQSVRRILEEDEVPPAKLVLGVPLYTRIWTETTNEAGETEVSSGAYGMETIAALIEEKELEPVFDEQAGQNYVEYEEDGARKRIWLEDETSLRARVQLVKQYDLAGLATWQRAFEKPGVWEVLDEVQSRP
ncbi:glycosyl hydrolase [Paenibacillus sp. IB182496]|uniref:Glycosyl hydrolase n=1 Tax=Paenibacillus sabuli TaxID=2772509 RepID=A0A927BVT6_9BACL|nr:glycosyl hydrolase family 18 protein [Paenibacillus sabuli]MBD2847766.1 glycosyl hydrolase [Paenibacillus sabuli]